jgi:hypothetical protein
MKLHPSQYIVSSARALRRGRLQLCAIGLVEELGALDDNGVHSSQHAAREKGRSRKGRRSETPHPAGW